MKYTILFVFAALAMSIVLLACSSSKNNNSTTTAEDGTEVAARKAVKSDINKKRLCHKWKLVRMKDNYDGEWRQMDESQKTISFSKSGDYTETTKENPPCTGTYTTLGKMDMEVNHSCNRVALPCRVAELEKKKLVISMMGRHGEVLYEYTRTK